MSGKFNFALIGLDDAVKAFRELDIKMRKEVLAKASKEGATLIRDRARQLAPKRTGYLKRYGITVRRTKRTKTYVEHSVTYTKRGFYGRFVELGTRPHKTGKGEHPGAQRHPHLRPAFDELQHEAVAMAKHAALEAIREATRR